MDVASNIVCTNNSNLCLRYLSKKNNSRTVFVLYDAIFFIFFVKKSFTLAIIIALYLCIDGVYAIFKYHQQNSNL